MCGGRVGVGYVWWEGGGGLVWWEVGVGYVWWEGGGGLCVVGGWG